MPDQMMCLADLIGDLVLFRDLNPLDPRLPRFDDVWCEIGLSSSARPRKQESAYAQVVTWFLRRARALDRPGVELKEILYVGDTALSDGNAFRNVRQTGGWRGWAFIGAERNEAPAMTEQDGVYVANRWGALAEFCATLLSQGAALDAGTAVIVDIDKTALGARGRNDRCIDRARLAAMEALIAEILGSAFDKAMFQRTYSELNVPKYHPFTADNQDYLAYICLMVTARTCSLEDLLADLAAGRVQTFFDFLARVDARPDCLAAPNLPDGGLRLRAAHQEVRERAAAGDPTPFKTFRRREYQETANRMGTLPASATMDQRLAEEICLTQEVLDLLSWLRTRGCLLLALSDKPDEASVPTPELAARGYQPLHRTPTHLAGPSIAGRLPK